MSAFIAGFDGHTCCNCGQPAAAHAASGQCRPATGAAPMGLLDGQWFDFRTRVNLDGSVSFYLDGEPIRYDRQQGWVRAP